MGNWCGCGCGGGGEEVDLFPPVHLIERDFSLLKVILLGDVGFFFVDFKTQLFVSVQ